jgi:antitoxin component HigA of HigAB toxin-antitoxin module
LVSLVLSGKRELSKNNIRALARHFKLGADYFL